MNDLGPKLVGTILAVCGACVCVDLCEQYLQINDVRRICEFAFVCWWCKQLWVLWRD